MLHATLFTLAVLAAPGPKAAPATNTRCPVTGEAVTAKSQVVVIRGHAYRICCPGCEAKLEKHPDQYLEKDGTPKNAKK